MKIMFALILIIFVVPLSALKSSHYDLSSESGISNYLSGSSKNVSQGTGLLNCETESKLTSYTANRSTLSTGSPLTYDHLEPDRYKYFRSAQLRHQRVQNRALVHWYVGRTHGNPANGKDYPFIVYIGFENTRSDTGYVGSLLTQTIVISASYWLVEKSAPEVHNKTYMWDCGDFVRSIMVRVGSVYAGRGGSLVNVKSLHRNSGSDIKYGILLLQLAKPVNFWVAPLGPSFQEKTGNTLADFGLQMLYDKQTVCKYVGWPSFSSPGTRWYPGRRYESLRYGDVTFHNWTVCSRYDTAVYGQNKRLVCMEYYYWKCSMNYGAPIICENILIAFQAYGHGCGTKAPKVFSLVGSEMEWMSKVIASLEQTKVESMQVTYTMSSCYLVISVPLLTTTTAFLLVTTTN